MRQKHPSKWHPNHIQLEEVLSSWCFRYCNRVLFPTYLAQNSWGWIAAICLYKSIWYIFGSGHRQLQTAWTFHRERFHPVTHATSLCGKTLHRFVGLLGNSCWHCRIACKPQTSRRECERPAHRNEKNPSLSGWHPAFGKSPGWFLNIAFVKGFWFWNILKSPVGMSHQSNIPWLNHLLEEKRSRSPVGSSSWILILIQWSSNGPSLKPRISRDPWEKNPVTG